MSTQHPRMRVPARGEGSLYYLRIVALHISGHNHAEIAETLGVSENTVLNALSSAEGIALVQEAKRRMRENVFGRIEAELIDLANISVDNLRETVEAKFVPGSRGKIHQDQIGLKLLGVIGYTEESLGERKRGNLQVSKELGERLLGALDKANESQEVHGGRDVTDLAEAKKDAEGSN